MPTPLQVPSSCPSVPPNHGPRLSSQLPASSPSPSSQAFLPVFQSQGSSPEPTNVFTCLPQSEFLALPQSSHPDPGPFKPQPRLSFPSAPARSVPLKPSLPEGVLLHTKNDGGPRGITIPGAGRRTEWDPVLGPQPYLCSLTQSLKPGSCQTGITKSCLSLTPKAAASQPGV